MIARARHSSPRPPAPALPALLPLVLAFSAGEVEPRPAADIGAATQVVPAITSKPPFWGHPFALLSVEEREAALREAEAEAPRLAGLELDLLERRP